MSAAAAINWHDEHHDHGPKSCLPFVTDDGFDARVVDCPCGSYTIDVRSIPAEGSLIDPDPHLPRGARP